MPTSWIVMCRPQADRLALNHGRRVTTDVPDDRDVELWTAEAPATAAARQTPEFARRRYLI